MKKTKKVMTEKSGKIQAFSVCAKCGSRNHYYDKLRTVSRKPILLYKCDITCWKCGNEYVEMKSIGQPLAPPVDIDNIINKVFDVFDSRTKKDNDVSKYRIK